MDENGQKVYRRSGHHYVVEPIALVFNEDNYYMVCYSAKHDSTANYRIDRMDGVEIIDEDICDKAIELRGSVDCFTEQAFKMYGGQPVDITIQFSDKLIGVVYDKFGEDTKMVRINENNCVASVKVQISPTFWGWLFQFGRQMKILSPQTVADEYMKQIASVYEGENN